MRFFEVVINNISIILRQIKKYRALYIASIIPERFCF